MMLCFLRRVICFLFSNIYENFFRELNPTTLDAQLNQDISSNFPTWFKQYVG